MPGQEKLVIEKEFCDEVIDCWHVSDTDTSNACKKCAYARFIKWKNEQEKEILTPGEVEHLLGGLGKKDRLREALVELHEAAIEAAAEEKNDINIINLSVIYGAYRTEITMKAPKSLRPDEVSIHYNI